MLGAKLRPPCAQSTTQAEFYGVMTKAEAHKACAFCHSAIDAPRVLGHRTGMAVASWMTIMDHNLTFGTP